MALSYYAGYIDGEGCFEYQQGKTPCVSVTNTYLRTLEELQRFFGGNIYKNRRKERSRQNWKWYVYGEGALTCLKLVMPYLKEKRKQAALVLHMRGLSKTKRRELCSTLREMKQRESTDA